MVLACLRTVIFPDGGLLPVGIPLVLPALLPSEQTHRICYGIELEEKFVDVIVNRYIEQCGSDADVFVIRDDMKISYQQLCKGGQYNETDDLP